MPSPAGDPHGTPPLSVCVTRHSRVCDPMLFGCKPRPCKASSLSIRKRYRWLTAGTEPSSVTWRLGAAGAGRRSWRRRWRTWRLAGRWGTGPRGTCSRLLFKVCVCAACVSHDFCSALSTEVDARISASPAADCAICTAGMSRLPLSKAILLPNELITNWPIYV